MAPAPINDPATLARVQGLKVVLVAPVIDAKSPTVRGSVKPLVAGKPTSDTLSVALRVCDPWGKVLAERARQATGREFQGLALGPGAKGTVRVTAEVARPGAEPLQGEAWAFVGDYAAAVQNLETRATILATLLKSGIANAKAEADRKSLERRLAVAEHALVWMNRPHDKPTDGQLIELAYLQRDLTAIAKGSDPMEAAPGESHLLAVDVGDASPSTTTHTMRFWVHLPANYSERHDWPLVIFLHGSTPSRDMVETFRSPLAAYPGGVGMPCVAICPKAERGWSVDALNQTLDYMLAHFDVNPDRVALLGHSMGGMGTISWMTKSPERFSAYAPIAGGGDPLQAGAYAYVPAWYVHGRRDSAVGLSGAFALMHFVQYFGGPEPRATIQPEGDHMSVFSVFRQKDFWTWFVDQKRKPVPAKRPEIAFDKRGLSPMLIENTAAGAFYAPTGAPPYDALSARDRSALEGNLRQQIDRSLDDANSPLCLDTPNAAAANATSATLYGFVMPNTVAPPAAGFDVRIVPPQKVAVRFYRGPAEGLAAALAAAREEVRDKGLEPTGEEWQLMWSGLRSGRRPGAPGPPPAIMRELRIVVRGEGQ